MDMSDLAMAVSMEADIHRRFWVALAVIVLFYMVVIEIAKWFFYRNMHQVGK